MTTPTGPGVLVLAALACGGIGCLCLLAAGITALATTIRNRRSPR
ncbi:hypothetical protein [Streptomyces sp. NPDC049590]